MALIKPSEIRKNVAASLEALSGWTESPHALDTFGVDTDQFQHRAFAVGVPSTDTHPNAGRRKVAEGLLSTSVVELRFAFRLKLDDQVGSVDGQLDAEHDAIRAAIAGASGFHLLWDRSKRTSPGKGWLLSTVSFTAVHRH